MHDRGQNLNVTFAPVVFVVGIVALSDSARLQLELGTLKPSVGEPDVGTLKPSVGEPDVISDCLH
jgi:hypothetical protein